MAGVFFNFSLLSSTKTIKIVMALFSLTTSNDYIRETRRLSGSYTKHTIYLSQYTEH